MGSTTLENNFCNLLIMTFGRGSESLVGALVTLLLSAMVAADHETTYTPGTIILDADGEEYEFDVMHAEFSNMNTGVPKKIRIMGDYVSTNRNRYLLSTGCVRPSLEDKRMLDSVIVIVRGGCSFQQKADNALQIGAAGMVVINECSNQGGSCNSQDTPQMGLVDNGDLQRYQQQLTAVTISEREGVMLLTTILQSYSAEVMITNETAVTKGGGIDSPDLELDEEISPFVDTRGTTTSGGMFGTFVLFSGAVTIVLLGIMSVVQFRQHRLRRRRFMQNQHRHQHQFSLDADRLLEELPVSTYPGPKEGATPDEEDICCICLDQFCEGDELRTLPCNHQWHKSCIDPWLRQNVTCPMCKDDVYVSAGIHVLIDRNGMPVENDDNENDNSDSSNNSNNNNNDNRSDGDVSNIDESADRPRSHNADDLAVEDIDTIVVVPRDGPMDIHSTTTPSSASSSGVIVASANMMPSPIQFRASSVCDDTEDEDLGVDDLTVESPIIEIDLGGSMELRQTPDVVTHFMDDSGLGMDDHSHSLTPVNSHRRISVHEVTATETSM